MRVQVWIDDSIENNKLTEKKTPKKCERAKGWVRTPTSFGVIRNRRGCNRLRINDDDVVRFSPFVVSRVVDESEANGINVLKTSVKSDVETAHYARVVASGGDVGIAEFGHGNLGGGIGEGYKGRLVHGNDIGRVSTGGRVQGTVDPLKNVTGSIVVAIVHVRLSKVTARVAIVLSNKRMRSWDGEVGADTGRGDIVHVKVDQFICDTKH